MPEDWIAWVGATLGGLFVWGVLAYVWGFFSQAGINHADEAMGYVEEEG